MILLPMSRSDDQVNFNVTQQKSSDPLLKGINNDPETDLGEGHREPVPTSLILVKKIKRRGKKSRQLNTHKRKHALSPPPPAQALDPPLIALYVLFKLSTNEYFIEKLEYFGTHSLHES